MHNTCIHAEKYMHTNTSMLYKLLSSLPVTTSSLVDESNSTKFLQLICLPFENHFFYFYHLILNNHFILRYHAPLNQEQKNLVNVDILSLIISPFFWQIGKRIMFRSHSGGYNPYFNSSLVQTQFLFTSVFNIAYFDG